MSGGFDPESPDTEITDALGLSRRRRRWPWVVGVLVVAVVLVGLVAGRGGGGNGRWLYDTRPVDVGDLTLTVVAVGTLEPVNTFTVGSELSGIVRAVHVDANDEVAAGMAMAELDTSLLQTQVRQARAQVASAEASVEQSRVTAEAAERDLARAESVAEGGGVSASSLDQARTAWKQAVVAVSVAEAQLRQARASLEAAEANLAKAVIRSPIDGVVLERNVEPGQPVVSSFQAATLFTVAEDLSRMSVEVEIDEADIGKVAPGQPATFTVAAYPDRVFDAVVDKVHLAPAPAQQVVTYEATLGLDNPEGLLLPGMTATARIVTSELTDAVRVPSAAMRFEPPDADLEPPEPREGKRVARVWVLDGGEPRPVEFLPGPTDGRFTVVSDGALQPDEAVIVDVEPRRGNR